ncbi:sugar transferase [Sinomonas sp. G460-2]|uniref:sugar transferase n=1 Tax=Sinomonas sp. G460-2 TaxID=3393464 RepID=UPI0039EEF75D
MSLLLVDLVAITWTVAIAELVRFGVAERSLDVGSVEAPYAVISLLLDVAWWFALGVFGARRPHILGYGPEEYKRVATASLWLFGAIAVVSFTFRLEMARGYVAVALPLGIASLLAGRWLLRKALIRNRRSGTDMRRVLLVGSADSITHLNQQLSNHPEAGYAPVAAYVTAPAVGAPDDGATPLPVVGGLSEVEPIVAAVEACGAETVALSGGAALAPTTLRQLGWELASRDIGMIMAPALTDVAGPRIHMQPVAGLPLIHVTTPRLDGAKALAKRGFDVAAALVLLALFAIPMAVVAAAVKLDGPGPLLFRQLRAGRAGEPFRMLKFRSMVPDAEARLAGLRPQNEGSGPLFKLQDDPRVTRVGRFMRRYSIDELPQLVNVLKGEMSLVGPRPPLPAEVATYDRSAHRRLLVKPGLTGLWQVSGRSDLSWDDSIRLDLYYVENWSMVQDVVILFRTFRAVFGSAGAY